MAIRKQTAGKLKQSVSSNDSIFIGAARAINQNGQGLIAYPPLWTDRYFIMDEFQSAGRTVYLFRVYKGTQGLNGCETYSPQTKIQPSTPYILPDALEKIVVED